MKYDTAEIRRAARSIQRCADRLEDAEPKMQKLRREVSSSFEGIAADALSDRLIDLDSDVKTLGNGLEALSRALRNFAERIEEADEKLSRSMK